MSLKDSLRKAAGLLVELPEEAPVHEMSGAELDRRLSEVNRSLTALDADPAAPPPVPKQTKTVDQIVRDTEGPALHEIKVSGDAPPPQPTADGKIDFSAIYQQAGLPTASFSAEQMLDMLASLPAEIPIEVKRQTMKVSLNSMGKAIGATPETIVADASRKLAALAAYQEGLAKLTADYITAAQLDIASLEAKIAERKRAIEAAQQKLTDATSRCHTESDRLDDVLEFFSLDLPPSKYAGPTPDATRP